MDFLEVCNVLFKISLAIFMAGNLLEMGLKLNLSDALKGLKNIPFLANTLIWGFVIGPGLAYLIGLALSLDDPYAMGLILLGMTPCAPFIPALVNRAKGDMGYTAVFMFIVAVATIVFMPFAVPFMAKGLTVSAWAIAKPLLVMVFIPLIIGMLILRLSANLAIKLQPYVKKITGIFTILMLACVAILFGKDIISVAGSFAIASQVIFFTMMMTFSYWFGFGLKHEQKIIISVGMSTRNVGAAVAPLLSVAAIDQRAVTMVAIGIPLMVVFGILSVKLFGKHDSAGETSIATAVLK